MGSSADPDPVPVPDADRDFVLRMTRLRPAAFVPEIMLHQADDVLELWAATEDRAGRTGLDPPFWAFPWAGGIGLARYLLDHPELARGRRVLDLGTGCGLVAVAAALAGAGSVLGNDVEPLALAATGLNAEANGVRVRTLLGDLAGAAGRQADPLPDSLSEPLSDPLPDPLSGPAPELLLAADVCYDREMSARLLPLLRRVAAGGAEVLLGDPGRAYLPRDGLRPLAEYTVPVPADLEGRGTRQVRVWAFRG